MKIIITIKYFIGVGIFLLIFTGTQSLYAQQVSVEGALSIGKSNNATSSITFSHTTGVGTDRLLLVGVSWNSGQQNRDISSATFTPTDGSAIVLTMVYTQMAGTDRRYSAVYSLLDPPSGTTGNVVVTFSGTITSGIVSGAVNFSGVDQTTPFGTPAGSYGDSTAPSVTLTGLNGDELVFDNLIVATKVSTETLIAETSQTSLWNELTSSTRAAASTEQASGSSVTMDWTASTTRIWAIAAVPIKPAINTWLGTTSTDWHTASNWSKGIPTSSSNVVIPQNAGNQPIISNPVGEPNQEAFAQSVIINSGSSLTIASTGKATFTSITNNGTLQLNSDADGEEPDESDIASLIVDYYSGEPADIQLYLTGGGDVNNYAWHYISSPVEGLSVNELAIGNDLAQFVESLPVMDPPNWQRGWISWDGWSYLYDDEDEWNLGTYQYGGLYAFDELELGKGYNYWYSSEYTFTLSGKINTPNPVPPATSLSCDVENEIWSGYNLLGNPYTSGLDIEYIMDPDYPQRWPENTLRTVWFTSNSVSYVYSNEVSVPVNADGHIPPMQGFFVKTQQDDVPFNFPAEAREHNSTARFKGEKASSISLIRLSVNENSKTGETVIRFNEKATAGLDIDFDAPRFMPSANSPSIYSSVNGADYTINGLPFPESSVEIPITVTLLSTGNHVITAMEIQELANYKVSLKDKSTGSTVDLNSVKEYSFSAPAGEIKDRFVLTVSSNLSTAIEDPRNIDNLFNIYSGFDLINIQPLSDQWEGKTGSIKLMDISGKTVRNQPNTEFMKNSLIQLPSPGNGIYFVEIRSGIMRYVGKVVVK